MADTSDPATDTGRNRLPDSALGEIAVAHAAAADDSLNAHPTAADLAAFRHEQAERNRRMRRTDKQLAFVYGLLFVAFFILAYKSQSTNARIQEGLYDACRSRVNTAEQYNIGRESLVQMVITGPNAPKDPAQVAALTKQLREGLLLPIEDCGPDPRAS